MDTQEILDRIATIPAFSALGVTIEHLGEGTCTATVPRNRAYDGVYDSYHGGLLMTAADTIALVALMTVVGVDGRFATTDMNIRFLAPCLTAARVTATIIKAGRTLCPIHVDIFDESQNHIAVAQVTYIRMPNTKTVS